MLFATNWSLRDENAQDAAIKAETQKLLYTPGVVELVANSIDEASGIAWLRAQLQQIQSSRAFSSRRDLHQELAAIDLETCLTCPAVFPVSLIQLLSNTA
jgi:hypothetical protein